MSMFLAEVGWFVLVTVCSPERDFKSLGVDTSFIETQSHSKRNAQFVFCAL